MMETDATKLSRVAKNQGTPFLFEDKMIVFFRVKSWRLDSQPPRHPEMNSEPVVVAEFKQHLLPSRDRAQEFLPNDPALERAHIGSAKDSLLGMQLHASDGFAEAGVPAFPKIFDLC